MKENIYNSMDYNFTKTELNEIKEKNITLYIDGKFYDDNDIANACMVLEKNHYMKEFVGDDAGKIVAINYNQVGI